MNTDSQEPIVPPTTDAASVQQGARAGLPVLPRASKNWLENTQPLEGDLKSPEEFLSGNDALCAAIAPDTPLPTWPIRGHFPLLWLLVPFVVTYTFCFTADFHAPAIGATLLAAGGGAALALAWWRPAQVRLWSLCHCAGACGLALLLFAANVAPLVDWEGLPPREATLVLRWEQVFGGKPDAKTISGVARVMQAPALLNELEGTMVYCQVRKPVSALLEERGTVFTATGVLDTTRRELLRPRTPPKPPPKNPVASRTSRSSRTPAAAAVTPTPAAAPDNFDAAGFLHYLENRRATMALTRARVSEVVEPPPAFLLWAVRQGRRMEAVLRSGLDGSPNAADRLLAHVIPDSLQDGWARRRAEVADLYAGILLGRRVSGDVRQTFSRTGTAHLFSVSGLHVGVIASLLFWLGLRLRAPSTLRRVVVIAVMFLFVMLTGGSPAALRAWFMVSCVLMAQLVMRRGSAGAGLLVAAATVLVWDPSLWLDISFQLSYGVVVALVFYGLPLSEWILERWHPFADVPPEARSRLQRVLLWLQRRLVGSFSISAAATLASAPLIVSHFHLFASGSLLANLLVVPLSFPVMVLGFGSIALGMCGAGILAEPLNWLAGVNLVVLGAVTRFASALPGMAWEFEYRAAWLGPAVALLLLAVFLTVPFDGRGKHRGWLFLLPPALLLTSFLFVK